MAAAYEAGDKEKIKELQTKAEEIAKKAEELGLDAKDAEALTDDQKERLKAATKKMMDAMLKNSGL